MARKKQQKYKNNLSGSNTPIKGKEMLVNKKKRDRLHFLTKIPVFLYLLIVIWGLLYFLYGDLLAVAEQRSFFAFDSTSMQYFLCQPLGWLYALGRFMLLSCNWPVVGSLLIALMLSVSAWFIDRSFRMSGLWHLISFSLPFLYFVYLFYMGLNLVYLREASWVMTYPLIALIVCVVIAIVAKLFKKSTFPISSFWNNGKASWSSLSLKITVLYVVVLIVAVVSFAVTYAQNDRITCTMERYLYDEQWDEMAQTAKKASQPSRTVVGLYAIALNQNGQLATELFNIPMQYGNIHLTQRDGTFDGGINYIIIYCNFYAGLTRSAYHEAMEQTVAEGPSVNKLKIMIKCAIIDHENELAEKYLSILSKVPFESEFVEKYTDMLTNYNKVLQDNELASILELQPVRDTYEQSYRKPVFLGYNYNLIEAKSVRGLYNSLYACLYTKDLNAFGNRVITLIQNNVMLPKIFEEAIVIQNIKHLSALKQMNINISPYTLQGLKDFMADCFTSDERPMKDLSKDEQTELSKQKARKFIDKYLGTYEFYYYFQNVPDENYVTTDSKEKAGVN